MDRKQGRRFDEDDEGNSDMNAMVILLGLFDDIDAVLENAALTAALMHYVFNKSQEYFSLLYYFTIQKYVRVNETKNDMRNYNHINMEIFTVFIHPKSVLHIPLQNTDLIAKIEETLDSPDCIIHLTKVSKHVVTEILGVYLDKFKESIRLGLESYSYVNNIHQQINRSKELKILSDLHRDIQLCLTRSQKSRCLPSPKQDLKNLQIFYDFQINAITMAMHTQYEYFTLSKKYCYVPRNHENIFSLRPFLSSAPLKLANKQRIKGHSFEETSLPKVGYCLVCDLILWGPYPNCLCCRNCTKTIHRECKDMVKYCQIDSKKNKKTELLDPDVDKEKPNEVSDGVLGQMTQDLTKIIDDQTDGKADSKNSIFSFGNDERIGPKYKDKPKVPIKPSKFKLQEWRLQSSSFSSDISKKPNVKYTKSMNSKPDIKKVDADVVTRSKSARSPSPKKFFTKEPNRFQIRSASEDSCLRFTVDPLPTSYMDDDEEMKVLETFEPEIELELFSKSSNKSPVTDKGEYKRLLVLMEFHHKTRFIRMTLKRFKYMLVDPWVNMGEYLELFDSLSLNCIDKLYKLIGSLVQVLDSCKLNSSYKTGIAEDVMKWLSDDDDRNLRCWLQLSTDLCCTNILQSVKENWIEQKQMSPRLNELFSVEINRMLIIDQLSNMRPLLFNLPMIVKKTVKDLKMFHKFEGEAKVWDQVGNKLSRLPQLIDTRCMPLVDLINNGVIMSSNLKYKRYKNKKDYNNEMEAYINNFPKTVFKNNFIDFQFVKISNLRESYHAMQSHVYVRDEIDAAVICYENEIILLQKENEKYLLKQFKSIGVNRLFPLIPFESVHVTKQRIKEVKVFQYELTVLQMKHAILAQILFRDERTRDMWFEHIIKRSNSISKVIKQSDSQSTTSTLTADTTSLDSVDAVGSNKPSNPDFDNTKMTAIRSSLYKSSNHFDKTFDLISKELSTEEPVDELAQGIKTGAHASSKFMYNYMNLLNNFMSLGSEMVNQSQLIDSNLLLQQDILSMNLPKIRDITKGMDDLIRCHQEVAVESNSSDESTAEFDISLNTDSPLLLVNERSRNVQVYIEDIINEALHKIQFNSQSTISDASENDEAYDN